MHPIIYFTSICLRKKNEHYIIFDDFIEQEKVQETHEQKASIEAHGFFF